MGNQKISNVVDRPITEKDADSLGMGNYANALASFIQSAQTPMTIALQGEWGSGKTSLMNNLRGILCHGKDDKSGDKSNDKFLPVWINTWHYSLMKTPQEAVLDILCSIIRQIAVCNEADNLTERIKAIGNLMRRFATFGAKLALEKAGVNGDIVDELKGDSAKDSTINALKKEIQSLVNDVIDQHNELKTPIKGFIIFVDDLDRIDSALAVELLELLKNIFDIEGCVFVLAIDYDVVIKGLKPKFGEFSEANSHEFRSFFDKIIQLPFTMPVATYAVDGFMKTSLCSIGFFDEKEYNDDTSRQVADIIGNSIGSNPRSLKRLINTLSLISILTANSKGVEGVNDHEAKLLKFAIVCIQIAYPSIYAHLISFPDFTHWDNATATHLKLPVLTEEEGDELTKLEEFDEDWEMVLYRMCKSDPYLSKRCFGISRLLSCIRSLVGEASIEDVMSDLLRLSNVTSVQSSENTSPIKEYKFNRDLSNYVYRDVEYSKKTDLVRQVVTDYIKAHPQVTYDELCETFRVQTNMARRFMKYVDYYAKMKEKGKVDFFGKYSEKDAIESGDGTRFLISSNWPLMSNGKEAEFAMFLERCKSVGIEIKQVSKQK